MDRRSFIKLSATIGAAILLTSYPVLIERNLVLVNSYEVAVDNLPASFNGFTIAHLTDIHLGALVSDSFVAGIVERTNSLEADIIACTGDYVHKRNSREEIDRVWPLLARLKARHGVYSVLGNHDHWADSDRSLFWLDETGQGIRHKSVAIKKGEDRLLVGGAGDIWEDVLGIDSAFSSARSDDCCILLSHNPDSVDTEFTTKIALTLCGHTHGGQVRLPFFGAPVLPVNNKRYSSGLIATTKTQLFISRGIGWAIYPVRFNCYPEIALLKLYRA